MKKKQLKFKIYKYECVDCGHNTWRDSVLEAPICTECQSTAPPKVTEDELVKEIVVNDTYTPEDYENAKRIAHEIIDGKPLEEIDGLNLGDTYVGPGSLGIEKACVDAPLSIGGFVGRVRSRSCRGLVTEETSELKNHYY